MTSEATPAPAAAGTVVLIHGLWMTPLSWEDWKQRFESRGYSVLAPGWPVIDDRSVQEIRDDPSPLKGVGVDTITDHYEQIIRGLDAPPIIMGHSFGGLVTQLLLARGCGAAGVSVDGAQPRGVLTLPLSVLRIGAWGGLSNPFAPNRVIMLSEKQFHYAFTNLIDDPAEAKAIYDRLPVPGPSKTLDPGRPREPQPERGHEDRLQEGARAAAAARRRQGPHGPGLGDCVRTTSSRARART